MPKRKRCIPTGKKIYPKQEYAIEVLRFARRRSMERRDNKKIPTREYECEHCGCWHLTSTHPGYGVSLDRSEEFKKYLKKKEE